MYLYCYSGLSSFPRCMYFAKLLLKEVYFKYMIVHYLINLFVFYQ